ncbi:hypothetical protein F4X86_00170 [Candidatus Saccharibacteria bacterium]|nr:hypothetical protein [Candidatus Saccharibacteria bacterium]
MPESGTEHKLLAAAGETDSSSAEAAHQQAKLAFETSCKVFDGAIGIENAWRNLDNWWDSPRYGGGLYGGHERADRQNKAVVEMIETFNGLQAAFNQLDEGVRGQLFETTAVFESGGGEQSAEFEFDLIKIMQGARARQRLQGFKLDEADAWSEETKQAYGQAAWEDGALYQGSILRAAEFIFGEKRRVRIGSRRKATDEQAAAVWQRMDEVGQSLGDMFLAALSNGHQEAVLRIYEWMYNFNVGLLNPSLQPIDGKYSVDGMGEQPSICPFPDKYRFQFAFFFLCEHLANWRNNAQENMIYKNSMWG